MAYDGVIILAVQAKVAELVDALDLGSSAAGRESSSLSFRTRMSDLLPASFLQVHSISAT